jgi:hypothetical protein
MIKLRLNFVYIITPMMRSPETLRTKLGRPRAPPATPHPACMQATASPRYPNATPAWAFFKINIKSLRGPCTPRAVTAVQAAGSLSEYERVPSGWARLGRISDLGSGQQEQKRAPPPHPPPPRRHKPSINIEALDQHRGPRSPLSPRTRARATGTGGTAW